MPRSLTEPSLTSNRLPGIGPLTSWLRAHNEYCDMQVSEIPWHMSREWGFDQGRLRHRTGGFFNVFGATIYRHGRHIPVLDQPLIDQPEIGILGFIVVGHEEGNKILVQGKPEPGNVNLVQAAPTVQATESNYKRRHRGKSTTFLELFLNGSEARILSNSLQSEHGTRFLGKYNRNMMVQVGQNDIQKGSDAHRWLPVNELLALLTEDFLVNTDARSVLTTSCWRFLSGNGKPFSRWRGQGEFGNALWRSYTASRDLSMLSLEEIVMRLKAVRSRYPFHMVPVGIPELSCWKIGDACISRVKDNLLSVRQYKVSTTEREVEHWDQPMFASRGAGLAILFCQARNGILHFLFTCRAEIGFREGFQYGPTIQDQDDNTSILPELHDQISRLKNHLGRALLEISCLHSDEGGRFHRCTSKYMICMLDPDDHVESDQIHAWMTLAQIEVLVKRPGIFSNEARSLVSMLLAYL